MPLSSSTWRSRGGSGQRGEHLAEGGREGAVVHDGPRPAVDEDVPELLGHVAVVDVDARRRGPWRRRACPRGTRCRCGGRARRGRGATPTPRTRPSAAVDAQARVAQHRREPPGAVRDVGPGEAPVAPHEALPVGHRPPRWPRAAPPGSAPPRHAPAHGSCSAARAAAQLSASVTVTVCILSPTWMAWATSMPLVTLPNRL